MREERYLGLIAIDDTLSTLVVTRNGSDVPTDADSAPLIRIYGASLVSSSTLTTFKDTGTVTGATNDSPIVISSPSHGLQNGQSVTLANVGGNSAANGTFTVVNRTASTFELAGSTGDGDWTSGGTWHTTGAYAVSITPTLAGGFAAGGNYTAYIHFTVSSTAYVSVLSFTVV